MDARQRCSRAAAVILFVVGGGLLATAAGGVVLALAEMPNLEGDDVAGHLELFALAVLVPLLVGGWLAMLAAWLLWGRRRGGVPLALTWVALGAIVSFVTWAATGNVLSAVRMIVVESAQGWLVSWPHLAIVTRAQGTYYSRVDDPTFWLPGVVVLATVAVGGLLIAGSIVSARRG